MWSIRELKQKGKAAFKANYWTAVVAGIILSVALSSSVGGGVRTTWENIQETGLDPEIVQNVAFAAASIGGFTGLLLNYFGLKPLEVGGRRFFLVNTVNRAELGEFAWAFRNNYINVVKTMFFRGLFTFLWSLLFIIPGIIKGYSYSMVPYIMAEFPQMDSMEAINYSRKMMDGEKLNKFFLDLSFIGWIILTVFTCGILGVFYVFPYTAATDAEFYSTVRGKCFA